MPSERDPEVRISRAGSTTVLSLVGDHDLSSAPQLRQDLREIQLPGVVVVDFGSCTFLDSTVLGVLASAGRAVAEAGGRLLGVRSTGMVRNALRLTGMEDLLLDEVPGQSADAGGSSLVDHWVDREA